MENAIPMSSIAGSCQSSDEGGISDDSYRELWLNTDDVARIGRVARGQGSLAA
jgi:hypothetical protein